MNNYFDYFNYAHGLMNQNQNNYNMINEQDDYNIDPYVGFIRGNLFDNTYVPYKNYNPARLSPKNEQENDLLLVQIYGFAAHELTLYLDTHPNDNKAIKLRSKYMNLYKQALEQYENKYGPINLSSSLLDETPWGWNTEYWPWEGVN